ncbi:MAG TPA: hypothetical protein VNO50_20075 [Pyrinomonadaceae bacterium]|nr:hypothetical protein [Pyrinomonadaceae bacterium]
MKSRLLVSCLLGAVIVICSASGAAAQSNSDDAQFGPVVRAYLGYLRNEQEVVDDRASRHEVNRTYYRRNSNRIRALRQMAIKIASETQNDYLPELEAVALDELGLILEQPPRSESLRIGEVLQTTFRYLGIVRAGEPFYVFARLDPYEQSELAERKQISQGSDSISVAEPVKSRPVTRARRVTTP